jgi:hypothetical protein
VTIFRSAFVCFQSGKHHRVFFSARTSTLNQRGASFFDAGS